MNRDQTFHKQHIGEPVGHSTPGAEYMSGRTLLTAGLLIACTTLHALMSSGSGRNLSQPRPNDYQPQLGPAVATVSADSSKGQWRNLHLDSRHYASVSSQADTSELNYLCMNGVSCGWVLNLKDETQCNKQRGGHEFRVRIESNHVVRDFKSRCAGYGLVLLGIEAGENRLLTDMIETSDTLQFSSVGNAGMFGTQHYKSQGAKSPLNTARVAAGL